MQFDINTLIIGAFISVVLISIASHFFRRMLEGFLEVKLDVELQRIKDSLSNETAKEIEKVRNEFKIGSGREKRPTTVKNSKRPIPLNNEVPVRPSKEQLSVFAKFTNHVYNTRNYFKTVNGILKEQLGSKEIEPQVIEELQGYLNQRHPGTYDWTQLMDAKDGITKELLTEYHLISPETLFTMLLDFKRLEFDQHALIRQLLLFVHQEVPTPKIHLLINHLGESFALIDDLYVQILELTPHTTGMEQKQPA